MTTTIVNHKAIKNATKELGLISLIVSLMIASKKNITQVSSKSKDQESIYKNEVSDKTLVSMI